MLDHLAGEGNWRASMNWCVELSKISGRWKYPPRFCVQQLLFQMLWLMEQVVALEMEIYACMWSESVARNWAWFPPWHGRSLLPYPLVLYTLLPKCSFWLTPVWLPKFCQYVSLSASRETKQAMALWCSSDRDGSIKHDARNSKWSRHFGLSAEYLSSTAIYVACTWYGKRQRGSEMLQEWASHLYNGL